MGPQAVARLPNKVVTCPVTPRGTSFPNGPFTFTSTGQASPIFIALLETMHRHFTNFHLEAARLTELVEQNKVAPNSKESILTIHKYSVAISNVMEEARAMIRYEPHYEEDSALREEADVLTISLAIWELAHLLFLDAENLLPDRLLKWFYRHFGNDDKHEWMEAAMSCDVDDPAIWSYVIKLASYDLKDDVCKILERLEDTKALCEFLRSLPSLRQIAATSRHRTDYEDHIRQVRARAKAAMNNSAIPSEAHNFLALYAGQRIEPVGWLDDLVLSYVWMSPTSEAQLGPLLREVVARQRDEELGAVDEVLFAAFSLDLTSMLEKLDQNDAAQPFFVTHLVDILYFAGRIPEATVREWYLSQYANYLCDENQQLLAVDYLEGGLIDQLRLCVEQLLGKGDVDDAWTLQTIKHLKSRPRIMDVIAQPPNTLRSICRVRSMRWKSKGDIARCIYWACQAEAEGGGRGEQLSELVDCLLLDNDVGLDRVLDAFKAPGENRANQAPTVYSGTDALILPNVPSGRLFFVAQYADALRLRNPNILAQLLVAGTAPPHTVPRVLQDILSMDTANLDAPMLLLLTRLYQVDLLYDGIHRADAESLKSVRKPMVHALAQSLLRTPTVGHC